MAVGLTRFNDSPTHTDKFDELHRRLVEHLRTASCLGPSEGLDGWSDVRRLRLARNLAQHQQVPPDHQTLVSWSGGLRRFVAHVVAVAYQVELTTVSAASAIEHDELRVLFVEAEQARDQGETRAAVEILQRVFFEARRLWESQRRAAIGQSVNPFPDEPGMSKAIAEATRHLDETLTVAPFALDLGEYFWWEKLLRDARDDRIVITEADAARAVTFVFTWIVRWESFSARYLGRDRLPSKPPEGPPASRRQDGTAELDPNREPSVEVRLEREYSYGPPVERWVLRVPYRSGRPEDEHRHHHHYLDQELWSLTPPPPWNGTPRWRGGVIELAVDPTDFDAGAVLRELEDRFERARIRGEEERVRVAAVRAEHERLEDAVAAVAPEVLAIRHDGEQPFTRVTLYARDPQPFVLAQFTNAFTSRIVEEVLQARPRRDLPDAPAPARLTRGGVAVPRDDLRELPRLAAESLTVLDEERRRIRNDRADTLLLTEALDAAAKDAMKQRLAGPTGPAH